MSMNENRHTDRSEGDGMTQPTEEGRKLRPYQAPRILSRERLESIAVGCSKATPGACGGSGPANS